MPGIKEGRKWVISSMQTINQRTAGIATGGAERRKAVLSEKRIVTTDYRSGNRENLGINVVKEITNWKNGNNKNISSIIDYRNDH